MKSVYWVSATMVAILSLSIACGGDDDGGGDPKFEGELGSVMFATQVPVGGFSTVTSTFANHVASVRSAPRGGDLMIRYPDGQLRNLTREAGFGEEGQMQANKAIAVREPTVHWSGNKALFSMAVGSISEQFQRQDFYWQIYEVSGIGRDDEVAIRKIPGQPEDFNNVSPIYGSDDKILFVSDRPRDGERHLYPQLDEYESQASTAGIYRLEEESGDFELIEHAPSGVFTLSLDSFGRVLFTKWDHLQRDQQGDDESNATANGVVTYDDESSGAGTTTSIIGAEVFPEPRDGDDPAADPAVESHRFNHFFPWEVNQDGSGEETLNHVGRQEWGGTFTEGNFVADDNLSFEADDVFRGTEHQLPNDGGTFHIRQDVTDEAWFLGTVAPEFGTGSGGALVRFEGDPAINPEDMKIVPLTPSRNEADIPEDTGYFRNPLRLGDGTYVASHTNASGGLGNTGSVRNPEYNYEYRLVVLEEDGDRYKAGGRLTDGIERTVSWYTPDEVATWSGVLWELDAVEVAPRDRPPLRVAELPAVEQGIFDDVGVSPDDLEDWMKDRDLALLVSRNVTQRDRNDVQQPFNLQVPDGVSSIAGSGTVYDVSHLQFFQGDMVRGYNQFSDGRRVLARPMHGPDLITDGAGPEGSVALGSDGSMAAFVPARRALSWQLASPEGEGIVRERNWVSFASGEIRVCASCHGINKVSQTGDSVPENEPAALRDLLEVWKAAQ